MKPDLYTKTVLTVIAIFLGVIAFEYRLVKDAHAFGSPEHITCVQPDSIATRVCYMFEGDLMSGFIFGQPQYKQGANNAFAQWNWRTGDKIK